MQLLQNERVQFYGNVTIVNKKFNLFFYFAKGKIITAAQLKKLYSGIIWTYGA